METSRVQTILHESTSFIRTILLARVLSQADVYVL